MYVTLFCMHTLVVLISLTAYISTDAKCSYNRCHNDQHKKLFSYRRTLVLCNKLLQNDTKNKILVILFGWPVWLVWWIGCWLDKWGIAVWFEARARDFFGLQRIQTSLRAHATSPQFNRYWELFPQELINQSMKLTPFLSLVQKLRVSGAIIPLPHIPLWHAQALLYF